MLSRKKQKRAVKKALHDPRLQKALDRASSRHFEKFNKTQKKIPWQKVKKRARAIREECTKILPELIKQFKEEAEKAGAYVYEVSTPQDALSLIDKIAREKNAKLIVKAKSMVSEEIQLNTYLEKKGYEVVETDLGEWIVQLARERPSHITAPALHKTKEEIAALLSKHLKRFVPPDAKEITKIAREEMRKFFVQADIGISGANLAIAESGSLLIVSNEGNARLVTTLPPVHIAIVTTEKFVKSMEQATTLLKALVTASSGHKMTAYVSYITGPSRTTDIEKELVVGVHGPQEVHIIILDNGRLKISRDNDLAEILFCLKCGGCMLVCPVFQSVGGHVFGGPVYPGGVGILMTAVIQSFKDFPLILDFCADCKKCEEFCPVRIHTGDLLLHIKNKEGPKLWEKVLSNLIREKFLIKTGAKLFFALQKIWQRNGHIRKLPFAWAKGKSFPAINREKISIPKEKNGPKVLVFEGCLTKFFFPEIRRSVFSSLSHFGYNVVSPPDLICCGAPSLHLGHRKDVLRMVQKNLESFKRESPDYIVTVCPTGNSMLKKTYPRMDPEALHWKDKIYDFTEFMVKKAHFPKTGKDVPKKDIFYHYPCHYLYDLKLKEEPKKILRELNFNPKVEEEPFACCGFCGIFSVNNPEISHHIWKKKREKIIKGNTSLIATDCPGCLFQLRAALKLEDNKFKTFHTAELLGAAIKRIKNAEKNHPEYPL